MSDKFLENEQVRELAPGVYYLRGDNESRFPFSSSLYLKGRDLRVLIDAGLGRAGMAIVREMGVDLLILSHCHLDHRNGRAAIPDVPVWCHGAERPFLEDNRRFMEGIGFIRWGFDGEEWLRTRPPLFQAAVSRELEHGERIDLGGMSIEVLHAPGHTPGHLAFFVPEAGLLYTSDVDLTAFGPFYGHDFADLGQLVETIRGLKKIKARLVATSHGGPFEDDVSGRFDEYERIIHRRERTILDLLRNPRTLDSFRQSGVIYRTYPEPADLHAWFELVHVEKHLESLLGRGLVGRDKGHWSSRKNGA
jgi:glyoxylase-like metal-dependent hydrolase (beta-lactamase superfamily II)